MLEEIYMVRVSCKLFETGTSRREERNLEEFVNKTGRSPIWKRARRRGTIRTNRKLPKDHLFILVSAQTIVSYSFFLLLLLYSFIFVSPFSLLLLSLFHRYLPHIRIREREGGTGHVFLSSEMRWHPFEGRKGRMEWRRTMLTSDEKSREKFCNCQIWYFTLPRCIYRETRVTAYFTPHTEDVNSPPCLESFRDFLFILWSMIFHPKYRKKMKEKVCRVLKNSFKKHSRY